VLPLVVAEDEPAVNDPGVPRAIALRHSEAWNSPPPQRRITW
jgi:hypothetical protein